MNRSIFQIWKFDFKNLFYSLIFSFFILFFINFDLHLDCFSVRGLNNSLLKEIKYNNIIFNCSKEITDFKAKNSLDSFYNSYNNENVKFSLCKYFELLNNKSVVFNKRSCYSHPNLFFGVYNDLYFNLQLSHNKFNNNFDLFSDFDINCHDANQFVCNRISIYNENLHQQYLNYNDLNKNRYAPFVNNYYYESQNYINEYENGFKYLINKII